MPTVADVLISFVCLSASAAVVSTEELPTYARALMDHLRPEVDVEDALNIINRQFFPDAKVVSTLNRPLVFPRRNGHETLRAETQTSHKTLF